MPPGYPQQLMEFWQSYEEVAFFNSINIYGYEIALERNRDYEIAHYVPAYILIGDDGGGQGIFLKRGDESCQVYYLGLGALDPDDFNSTGCNFIDWIIADPSLEEDTPPTVFYDVVVDRQPTDVIKFIMAARKELKLTTGISEMKAHLQHLPYRLLHQVTMAKWEKTVIALNERFDCLNFHIANPI